jgi:branched-chain amino acid transport system substrate-binding protein
MEILGRQTLPDSTSSYTSLANEIQGLAPDLVYFGGTVERGAGTFLSSLRSVGETDALFMGADGILQQLMVDTALDAAEGTYATIGGIPFAQLKGLAKVWYDNYREAYKSEPQILALYGFEATNVVLDAINTVCKVDRKAVRQAVFNTKDYDGVLGKWSFDNNGDTSYSEFSGYQVRNGSWEFVQILK